MIGNQAGIQIKSAGSPQASTNHLKQLLDDLKRRNVKQKPSISGQYSLPQEKFN